MTISVESFEKLVKRFGKVKALVLFFEIAPEENKLALSWEENRELLIESMGSGNDKIQYFALERLYLLSRELKQEIFVLKHTINFANMLVAKSDQQEQINLVNRIKDEIEKRLENYTVLEDWLDVYADVDREILFESVKASVLACMRQHIEKIIIEEDKKLSE